MDRGPFITDILKGPISLAHFFKTSLCHPPAEFLFFVGCVSPWQKKRLKTIDNDGKRIYNRSSIKTKELQFTTKKHMPNKRKAGLEIATVWVDHETLKDIKALAKKRGITLSDLLRDKIDETLIKELRESKKSKSKSKE